MRAQKSRMLIEMQRIKTERIRFQVEMRTLVGMESEAICVTFWKKLSTFYPVPKPLSKLM
jgi:hypothetical protein